VFTVNALNALAFNSFLTVVLNTASVYSSVSAFVFVLGALLLFVIAAVLQFSGKALSQLVLSAFCFYPNFTLSVFL
jgi:hypothetical protein